MKPLVFALLAAASLSAASAPEDKPKVVTVPPVVEPACAPGECSGRMVGVYAAAPKFGIPEMATYVGLAGEKTGYDICTPPDFPSAAKASGTAVVLVTVRPGGGIDHVELEGGAKPDAITSTLLDSARSCLLPGTGKRRVVKAQYWWRVE